MGRIWTQSRAGHILGQWAFSCRAKGFGLPRNHTSLWVLGTTNPWLTQSHSWASSDPGTSSSDHLKGEVVKEDGDKRKPISASPGSSVNMGKREPQNLKVSWVQKE